MAFPPSEPPGLRSAVVHLIAVPLVLGLAAHLLQHSSYDVAISSLFFDAEQKLFVGKRSGLFELLGHQAARGLPILVGLVAVGVAMGSAFRASLRPWRPLAIALAIALVLTPSVISLLKSSTAAHCPHSIDVFGGQADYAAERDGPFWAASKASAGRCLPSAHAGAGYALLSLYFVGWAAGIRRWRWAGLAIGIVAGLMFSAVRISQGSHFASQTLWSATVAWTMAALVFAPWLWGRRLRRKTPTSALA
jgi:membrane-associated PAP2 superfamily phosphatase